MLRRLLIAGFPPDYALRSLNSLCALRSRAGAVTVDLAEISLESGRAAVYKWGAAPSYLITALGAEKIGTAGPPPGLSVSEQTELQYRLSLHRGERLVLVSDGVADELAMGCLSSKWQAAGAELAQCMLRQSVLGGEDDATVVVVQLREAE